jgi:hypothetical protein
MCSWVGHSPDHMRRRRRPRQPLEGANFHAAPPRRSFIFRPGLDCVLIGAWRYRKELAPTIETRTKLALALASKCISRPGAHRLRITILMAMAYGDATVTARSLKYQTTLATGAPRPTKMGTIVSPWRYDGAVRQPLRSVELRRTAILHYASQAEVFPNLQGGPVTRR